MRLAKKQSTVAEAKRKLKKLFSNPKPTDVLWNYKVGQLVEAVHPIGRGREYGTETIPKLAEFVQPGGPKSLPCYLLQARKFVLLYTPAQAKAVARLRDADGQPLGWQRMMPLLSVLDPQKRENLMKRCLTQRWTVRQLQLELQLLKAGGKQSYGGRPPTIPTSPRKLLADLSRLGERWLRWGKQLGLVDDHTKFSPSAEPLEPEVRFAFVLVRRQVEVFLTAVRQQDSRQPRRGRPAKRKDKHGTQTA